MKRIIPPYLALDLESIRERLVGQRLDPSILNQLGVSLESKGRFGIANELLLGLPQSPSPEPDLEDVELKTTVLHRNGQFRESVKICMCGSGGLEHPLRKLEHIYLVIARDEFEAIDADRSVRNEAVLSLKPSKAILSALQFDLELLADNPRAKVTHFLETRTAGASGKNARAYYVRKDKLLEYVNATLVRDEFKMVRDKLGGLLITEEDLRAKGLQPKQKNRISKLLTEGVGRATYAIVRTGPVDSNGEALEDLLICHEDEHPVPALSRMLYVQVERLSGDRPDSFNRLVRDVIQLMPTPVVRDALLRDLRTLRKHGTLNTYLLKLKPHAQKGHSGKAFYIVRKFVSKYVALVLPS